jgi:hypothetical protein
VNNRGGRIDAGSIEAGALDGQGGDHGDACGLRDRTGHCASGVAAHQETSDAAP